MVDSVPLLDGNDYHEIFNLDDPDDWSKLGISLPNRSKRADKYVHYINCPYAIIEQKSSTIKKAISQLEETAKNFMSNGKNVDYLVIVADKIRKSERSLFRNERNILFDPRKKEPYRIRVNSKEFEVRIYYREQIKRERSRKKITDFIR